MVINFLAAEQASISEKFSRPDLYPEPFRDIAYSLTKEGVPVLEGCLGAISCKLVSQPLPLHDLEFLGRLGRGGGESLVEPSGGTVSELFIARVLRVEETSAHGKDERQPLLYHRRGYTTCLPTKTT
jgi:flavin reductase (DIM6/NTAB) family NADH-FMN oxidoreductase RutF